VGTFPDFLQLLEKKQIDTLPDAMRNKGLAKLGDPLTNFIHSLAQSKISGTFYGKKVSGKILAMALRLAELRKIAPPRLDAHDLADCVEAAIAYGWIRGYFSIEKAITILAHASEKANKNITSGKMPLTNPIAYAFAELLKHIWIKDQETWVQ
jgi:hypothetical protein